MWRLSVAPSRWYVLPSQLSRRVRGSRGRGISGKTRILARAASTGCGGDSRADRHDDKEDGIAVQYAGTPGSGRLRRGQPWQRYSIAVQYAGSGLGGAAGRPGSAGDGVAPSVQELMESALDKFVGEENHRAFQFSSRTDAGVHALRNTLHVDLRHRHKQRFGARAPHAPRTIQRALNHFLAAYDDERGFGRQQRIGVIDVEKKSDAFHARFDAKSRAYVYRLIVRQKRIQHRRSNLDSEAGLRTIHTDDVRDSAREPSEDRTSCDDDMCGRRSFNGVFTKDTAWLLVPPDGHLLNADAMQAAASALVGTHDFTSFRSAGCQAKSPVKTLDVLEVRERTLALPSATANTSAVVQLLEDPALYCRKLEAGVSPERGGAVQEILIVVKARSFMYNQVRNIVGFLVDVGQTGNDAAAARETARSVLQSRNRSAAAYVKAPAKGLALVDVEY